MLIPMGVEGSSRPIAPAGAGIALVCVALFVWTWVLPDSPLGTDEALTRAAVDRWRERPYLELSEDFISTLLGERSRAAITATRRGFDAVHHAPPPATRRAEQEELDGMMAEALAAVTATPFRVLALEPRRGWLQVGWVTHQFLHAGWMHLLLNLLFLYAVALLLEEAWGPWRFLLFFVAGGVVAALTELKLGVSDTRFLVGASGAVSACTGAAMVGFHWRRMKVGYFLLVRRGVFTVPVWWWGVLLAAAELVALFSGRSEGVAVLGHAGGLMFGVLVGLTSGLEGSPRAVPREEEVRGHDVLVADGQRALSRGDPRSARVLFDSALRTAPGDLDAQWGRFDADVATGEAGAAAVQLERIVQQHLRAGDVDLARSAFLRGEKVVETRHFRTGFALAAAKAFGNTIPRDVSRALWARAGEGDDGGLPAALAAAELALSHGDLDTARPLMERIDRLVTTPGELASRVDTVRRTFAALREHEQALSSHPGRVSERRHVFPATLVALTAEQLEVGLDGGARKVLSRADVKGVAAGLAAVDDHHRALFVYLVLDWGEASRPAVLLRLDSDRAGVERVVPGRSRREAYDAFLRAMLERPSVQAIPSRPALLGGDFPFAADPAALEQQLFHG